MTSVVAALTSPRRPVAAAVLAAGQHGQHRHANAGHRGGEPRQIRDRGDGGRLKRRAPSRTGECLSCRNTARAVIYGCMVADA